MCRTLCRINRSLILARTIHPLPQPPASQVEQKVHKADVCKEPAWRFSRATADQLRRPWRALMQCVGGVPYNLLVRKDTMSIAGKRPSHKFFCDPASSHSKDPKMSCFSMAVDSSWLLWLLCQIVQRGWSLPIHNPTCKVRVQ